MPAGKFLMPTGRVLNASREGGRVLHLSREDGRVPNASREGGRVLHRSREGSTITTEGSNASRMDSVICAIVIGVVTPRLHRCQ